MREKVGENDVNWPHECTGASAIQQTNKPNQTKLNHIKSTKEINQPIKSNHPTNLTSILAQLLKCWSRSRVSCPLQRCHVPARQIYKPNPAIKTLVLKTFRQMFVRFTFLRKIVTGLKLTNNFSNKTKQILFDFSHASKSIILGLFFSPHNKKNFFFTFSFQTWKSLLPGSCQWWSAGLHSTQNCFMLPSILY